MEITIEEIKRKITPINGVNISKKLFEKERDVLAEIIFNNWAVFKNIQYLWHDGSLQ